MKKLFFLTALAFLSLSSFAKVNLSALNAPAQPYNIQYDFDVTGNTIYDPCTGENVILSGTEHLVLHGVYNPNTGTYKQDYSVNLQGVSGVGETTGNKYQFVGGARSGYSTSSDGCTITSSWIETVNITTAGANNNLYEKIRYTTTYNYCTGEYTVKREVFESGCK